MNVARLDLISMKLLLECAARGSISAAAGHCHLSLMGASRRLRRLEDTLGKPLFHRHRHGLEPTEAGVRAIHRAQMVLKEVQQLISDVAATAHSPPTRPENVGRRGSNRKTPVS